MVEYSEVITESVVITQTVDRFELIVWYTSKHEYRICVTEIPTGKSKTSHKSATYEPIFGIDQADLAIILAEAEALCEQFESEDDQSGNN